MDDQGLLEILLELAERAEIEVRVLSESDRGAEFRPSESTAGRLGDQIWVVLAPSDPVTHQARVLADALVRYREAFLDETYIPPGAREFIDTSS